MDEEALNCVTRKLIEPRPNTYTFTKAIAESLIVEECGSLPCAIVRPSIVGASWQEPVQVNDQVKFLMQVCSCMSIDRARLMHFLQ